MKKKVSTSSHATLSLTGRITLPLAIRKDYGLKAGDILVFFPVGIGELRVKVVRRSMVSDLLGLLGNGKPYLGSAEAERKAAALA